MKKNIEFIIGILAIVAIIFAVFLSKKAHAPIIDNQQSGNINVIRTPITISEEDIHEDNFTGSKSVIEGSGVIADNARAYIEDTVASFKKSADEEVPAMRKQFGDDSPTSHYELVIKAIYLKNNKTESIVIDQYVYTGGANGSSSYKVFNQSVDGRAISLSDIIASDKQDEFVNLVKNKLLSWKPEDSEYSPVFKDAVMELSFESFDNWSIDDQSLTIYFDKYAIGPGALGAIKFPVKISEIKGLLSI